MSTMTKWEAATTSPEETERLAEKLAHNLHGGEVIEFVSDLGGGKTTFMRGLVHGAGSKDHVRSPTFTLSSEYKAPKFTIAHFDFYRLSEAGIVADELAEVVGEPDYVVGVEWGDIVQDVLPAKRMTIRLQQSGAEARAISFEYPVALEYLLEGVK